MAEKRQYDINAAAKELGFSTIYIRTLIRKGVIKTTRVPLAEGSLVTKHVINEDEMQRFLKDIPHKSRRDDGRNKYILYARPDEYMQAYQVLTLAGLQEIADLIVPANKVMFWKGGDNGSEESVA